MKFLTLASHNKLISNIGIGTMMIGWRADQNEAKKILKTSADLGITFLDTSVSYSRGLCHKILGNILSSTGLYKEFIIATKVGGISCANNSLSSSGFSKKNILRQCNLSLKQLKLEKIDILQLHNYDPNISEQEKIDALYELQKQGKIISYGVCNYKSKQFLNLLNEAKKKNSPTPITNQFEYNFFNDSNSPLFKIASETETITITWGLLSSGLINPWTLKNCVIKENSRISISKEKITKEKLLTDSNFKKKASNLLNISKQLRIPIHILSLLYIHNKFPQNCVLLGPSSEMQLKSFFLNKNGYIKKFSNSSAVNLIDNA
jgi:aryl-alcohol dehydrogenase-like predicted oxidoreductase